jgi:chorismate lyase / 3-hydroxybenzoate synthase
MEFRAPPLGLAYLTPREFDKHQREREAHTLGVIAFNAQRPAELAACCPFAQINMPALDGEKRYEVWTANRAVAYSARDEITSAHSDEVLFGCLQVDEARGRSLESLTFDAYVRLFAFVDREGYGNLLRIWHYLPRITEDSDGLERYHRFSVGRHEAFAAKRGGIAPPAACALGSRDGSLTIYFLAGRGAATAVENPRQISAYRYPPRYGPRSPSFSRATMASLGVQPLLFISGTASIVGHESVHLGDPAAQTRETIANIQALFARAAEMGFEPAENGLRLKIYVRHAEHFPAVRAAVSAVLGPSTEAMYLQADICRTELLLEIEGICLSAASLSLA